MRRLAAILLASTSVAVLAERAQAQAVLPKGGTVTSGVATIGAPSGNALTITQSSSKAVIDWNSFSVGPAGSVTFVQPNAGSAHLHRVTLTTSSTIPGHISPNVHVFLINPNGIAITSTGTGGRSAGSQCSRLPVGPSARPSASIGRAPSRS